VTAGWTPSDQDRPPGGESNPGSRGHAAGRKWTVDAGKLWAGGVATAVVAALIAIVGIVLARGIFDVDVIAPHKSGTWGNANTAVYALAAFGFGLLATGLMHVLLIATPSPVVFFGWILGLCTLLGALAPFATSADVAPKVSTAIINAVIGIAVWSLTVATAHRSVHPTY
jgi:uncharacterized protein DUF6069